MGDAAPRRTEPQLVLPPQVRQTRERRGWNQAELAEAVNALDDELNWHQTTVAKIEKQERQVSVREVFLLAVALGVSPLHLFIPRDDDLHVQLGSKQLVTPSQARAWVRGQTPLPGMDEKTFRTEVPESEWPREPSEREKEARARWDSARRDVRIYETLLGRLEDDRKKLPPAAGGPDLHAEERQRHERKIDDAYRRLAEALVDVEVASANYYAAKRATPQEIREFVEWAGGKIIHTPPEPGSDTHRWSIQIPTGPDADRGDEA